MYNYETTVFWNDDDGPQYVLGVALIHQPYSILQLYTLPLESDEPIQLIPTEVEGVGKEDTVVFTPPYLGELTTVETLDCYDMYPTSTQIEETVARLRSMYDRIQCSCGPITFEPGYHWDASWDASDRVRRFIDEIGKQGANPGVGASLIGYWHAARSLLTQRVVRSQPTPTSVSLAAGLRWADEVLHV